MSATKILALILLLVPTAIAQEGDAANSTADKTFAKDRIEQLVAPIALYPDALVSQVLMAATYPTEVVEASRWAGKKKLTGDQLETALQEQTWDPSVKSLCAVPDVLKRMGDNLNWTQDLGDAFLAQQSEVMDAVQTLRRQALEAGNLESGKELEITDQGDKIIIIESTDPDVIYVPVYYPSSVYGPWGYPTWYYPPLYVPPPHGGLIFGFGVGIAWGWACWGGCHWGWGHSNINININHYNTFINKTEVAHRRSDLTARAKSGSWQHNPEHRQGVAYKDSKSAKQFAGKAQPSGVTRDQARGFARGEGSAKPDATNHPANKPDRPAAKTPERPSPTTKPATRPEPARPSAPAPRPAATPAHTGKTSGSLSGARNAKHESAASHRGSVSRSSGGSRGAARPSGGGGGRGGRR